MKKILFCLLFPLSLFAQIQGEWEGEIQKLDLYTQPYNASAIIRQDGAGITGQLLISYPDTSWFCLKKFVGRFSHSQFDFVETEMVSQKHEDGYWFYLSGTLFYDKTKEELSGYVDALDPFFQIIHPQHDFVILKRKKNYATK